MTDESRDSGSFPRPTQERKTSVAEILREQWRKLAAVIMRPAPASVAPPAERRRTDETKGMFKLARTLTKKIRRSIFNGMFAARPYDPEAERLLEAEQFLRSQLDQWEAEDAQEHHESFHYGSAAADFDPQP